MTLRDQIETDALSVFANTDEFAEATTYTPDGGSPVTWKAVIERDPEDASPQDRNRAIRKVAKLHGPKGTGTGALATVTLAKDKVSFPEVEGGSAVDWIVSAYENRDDPGMWHLVVYR